MPTGAVELQRPAFAGSIFFASIASISARTDGWLMGKTPAVHAWPCDLRNRPRRPRQGLISVKSPGPLCCVARATKIDGAGRGSSLSLHRRPACPRRLLSSWRCAVNLMKKPRIPQDYRQAIAVFDPLGKLPREAQIELAEEIGAALQRHHLGNLLDIYDEMRRRYPDSGPK